MANEKILIVDDEGNSRTLLKMVLEKSGYQVIEAEDGDAGYQLAKVTKPDLIISDIIMPQMDGNQLMRKLRESVFAKHLPFIVVSARGKMQEYFEMMRVDDFISKPFDPKDLLERVERVLNKYGKNNEDGPPRGDGRKRVLILDNETQERQNFKNILMSNKFEVNTAKTLDEAMEAAVSFKPDLVVLRFLIDNMDGDRMVKTLKEIPKMKDTPVIVYSRKIRGWEEKKVKDAGASSFLGEVTEEKLLEAVKKTI